MISEASVIQQISAMRARSPAQRNGVHETDAEIVSIDGNLLALTSDCLCEELQRGLVVDLYTVGWFSVLMSLSDLSAVGATPLGVLLGLNLPEDVSEEMIEQIYSGVEDCCSRHSTFVLGGDTNHTKTLSISTTAIGKIDGTRFMSRTPLRPGCPLYVSGHVGTGNLAAYLNLANECRDSVLLQNEAQIALGRLLLDCDGKAIDTSDGLLFSLNHLFNVNPVGFHLDPARLPFHPIASEIMRSNGLSREVLALGEVGDYELLFTVPVERQMEFETRAVAQGFSISRIGSTTEKREIVLGSRVLDLPSLKAKLDGAPCNESYMRILAGEAASWSARQ